MLVGFTTTCVINAYHHWYCEFESRSVRGVLNSTLCLSVTCDKLWFCHGTLVYSINKTDHHDITEILLKVALNTITLYLSHVYYNQRILQTSSYSVVVNRNCHNPLIGLYVIYRHALYFLWSVNTNSDVFHQDKKRCSVYLFANYV
jgi:hypothetical protein